ncbi:neuronal acetylcholine receptor subunit alpha-10-like [Leuresthes tenuis]|uniref:neuronal acetylcholine receptor subunit alpha-10-like n=1 Tax=Leuresthes tenuis TaxID=355514 RepID=UPI003B507680
MFPVKLTPGNTEDKALKTEDGNEALCAEASRARTDLSGVGNDDDSCTAAETPPKVATDEPIMSCQHKTSGVNQGHLNQKPKENRVFGSHPAMKRQSLQSLLRWDRGGACSAAHGRYAQKLLSDLFSNYTNALRPVEDTDHIINVTLQITLSQIIDMDERNQILTTYLWIRQVWMDAYLTWRKEDYDGLDTIRIPSSYVWRPDIVLYNSADDEFSSSMETNVVLRHDGQVMWDQPAITKSSCLVDVAFFPFDVQQCHLTFGSWTHNGNQMDLFNALDSADLSDFVPNVEWEVLGMPAKKNVILYGCCSDPYPDITFTLHLKRRASFYIFNLLIPCMMISFLAPLGFFLPADSGEKVSLGVTVLLALTVFQLLVAESMPPSESVPLIGKYYIATMTMVTASTALTIFIMNVHHCGPEARPVPQWAERLVLNFLARICFVNEVGESCLGGASSRKQPLSQEDSDAQSASGGSTRGTNWDVNGQVWGGRGDEVGGGESLTVEQDVTKQTVWKEDLFVTVDHSEGKGATVGREDEAEEPSGASAGGGGEHVGEKKGVGGGAGENRREILVRTQCVCQHQRLRKNIEYIANSYQDQRTGQMRIAEWRKVAKVMDRFFMWLFFIMFFFMSILILGKAI